MHMFIIPNHTTLYNSLIKFISFNVHLLYDNVVSIFKKKTTTPIKIFTACESTLTFRSFRPLIITFDVFRLRLEMSVYS